ncbi:MAG: adenine phosphoribosyltransferase [Actinomycetota bacterium]|nr:adenine phosphoribosyltransferase [Actinomycetota bacterium]
MLPEVEQLLRSQIRQIDDWPMPGVRFQDLTGLMAHGRAFSCTIAELDAQLGEGPVDEVVGIEARGFPYGAALAQVRGAGFVTVRKPGKLPGAVHAQDYALEYGNATLELHQDALGPGRKIVIVDDVLATGGTAAACIDLVRLTGAEVTAVLVVMEIQSLGGRDMCSARGVPVVSLLSA